MHLQHIVVFKNPGDASQIVHLIKQAYPGKVKAVQEAIKDATSTPFGYLLLDFIYKRPTRRNGWNSQAVLYAEIVEHRVFLLPK